MRIVAKLSIFLLLCVGARAQSISVTRSGNILSYSWSVPAATSLTSYNVGLAHVSPGYSPGPPWTGWGSTIVDRDGSTPGSGSGTYTLVTGDMVLAYIRMLDSTGGWHQVSFTSVGTYTYSSSTIGFHVHWCNTTGHPVKARLMQSGSLFPGSSEITLANGDCIDQDFSGSSGDPVTLEIGVEDANTDGVSWWQEDGTVTRREVGTITPTEGDPGTWGDMTIVDVALPSGPTSDADKTVWVSNSTATGGTDNKTYREGVDKIVAGLKVLHDDLNGEAVTPASAPTPDDGDAKWKPTDAVNASALGKLPSAPTLSTTLTAASSVHISFTIPKLTGGSFEVDKTVDFSAAPYATPISVFRGLMLVLITLVFFLACFYTIRGAFAGK